MFRDDLLKAKRILFNILANCSRFAGATMPVTPTKSTLEIAVLGEFNPEFPPHPATDAAIQHSARQLDVPIHGKWLSTTQIRPETLKPYAGIWIAPGSPYKSLENTLLAIRYARETFIRLFKNQ